MLLRAAVHRAGATSAQAVPEGGLVDAGVLRDLAQAPALAHEYLRAHQFALRQLATPLSRMQGGYAADRRTSAGIWASLRRDSTVSGDNWGLVEAIQKDFQGVAWQRCQMHVARNALGKVGGR